jgi:uncharacterized membrane protein
MATSSTPLPAHVEDAVRKIAELHAQHHRKASRIQRTVDRMVRLVGRPRFVGVLTGVIAVWIGLNLFLQFTGHKPPDPAPFGFLQDAGAALSLYITVLILITQRREDQLAEQREQLTLELALINDQKTAKIIQLLEEMRRDNPMMTNRADPQAAALSNAADPEAVLNAISTTNDELLAVIEEEFATGERT